VTSPGDPSSRIPDDARELDPDRLAYLREQSSGWMPGWMRTRRWVRYGLSGPLVTTVLAVVAGFGALLLLLGPRPPIGPAPTELAQPTVQPGQVGGLLPDVEVQVNNLPTVATELRPAVLAIVPSECADCAATVRSIYVQAAGFRLPTVLVGSDEQQLRDLDRTAAGLGATVAVDSDEVIATAVAASGLTVVAVHSDGIIASVVPDVRPDSRLESALAVLAEPGART
jgi:hypothetical protein